MFSVKRKLVQEVRAVRASEKFMRLDKPVKPEEKVLGTVVDDHHKALFTVYYHKQGILAVLSPWNSEYFDALQEAGIATVLLSKHLSKAFPGVDFASGLYQLRKGWILVKVKVSSLSAQELGDVLRQRIAQKVKGVEPLPAFPPMRRRRN
jgi:hypothetical protein